MYDWNRSFDTLFRRFAELLESAERLESSNVEDDLFIRMAIVGHSLWRPTSEEWGADNLHLIQRYRAGEYSDDALAEHEVRARAYALFACLALGFALGAYQAGQIDDVEFSRGEALLPGFMALRSTDLPIV